MADPLSILGAAVGVTSLVFQVGEECIKGYHFYCKVVSMPADCQHLVIRMQMEQRRFLSFSQEAGLLWTEEILCDTLQVNQSLLLAILAEVKSHFELTRRKLEKYTKSLPEQPKQSQKEEPSISLIDYLYLPETLEEQDPKESKGDSKVSVLSRLRKWHKSTSHSVRSIKDIVLEPKRIVWAAIDQAALEQLIDKLAELNSFLIVLLTDSQKDRLRLVVANSYQEILQVREDVQNLTKLIAALEVSNLKDTSSGRRPSVQSNVLASMVERETQSQMKQRDYLLKLAEIKVKYKRSLDQQQNVRILEHLQPLAIQLFAFLEDLQTKRSFSMYQNQRVWIEWKETPDSIMSETAETGAEDRIKLLTDLVCNEKPESFRSPQCLGYVKRESVDDGSVQYGIVFEDPSQTPNTKLTTLRELLDRPAPSLSQRLALSAVLARCLYSFHTVGWLHKGVRSENVVFFSDETSQTDLSAPFLVGFQLSRPDILDEMTLKPGFDPMEELYRHPNAQSIGGGASYRRSYDMYSLALVLIEIATWVPLEMLLDIKDLANARPRALQHVRDNLLEEVALLDRVATAAGDGFSEIVEACIRADEIERPLSTNESTMSVEIRLQRMLGQAVKQLEDISRVLATS